MNRDPMEDWQHWNPRILSVFTILIRLWSCRNYGGIVIERRILFGSSTYLLSHTIPDSAFDSFLQVFSYKYHHADNLLRNMLHFVKLLFA